MPGSRTWSPATVAFSWSATASAPSGSGFLAGVVRDWEAAAQPARDAGVRVVHPRTGLVLSPSGGLLGPLKPDNYVIIRARIMRLMRGG